MADAASFPPLVPGFDFLQTLVKNAGAAIPGMGQWVAPTLNPEELQKRIDELKTVQFWLEQNARMLGVTIQALEVQRMTLSTLKTMNVQMGDLRDAMTIRMPGASPAVPPSAAAQAPAANAASAAAPPPGVVDPMQWWGALTKQFTEIATAAVKDGGSGLAKNFGGGDGASAAPTAAAAPDATPGDAATAAPKGTAARKRGAPPSA